MLSNLSVLTSTIGLPASPWTYHVPQTNIQVTVLFFEVVKVSEGDLLACLLQAANDIIAEIEIGVNQPICKKELAYDSYLVRLSLHPEPEMTWAMWGATIRGLTHFVEMYDPVSMLFDARDLRSEKTVGGGGIHNKKPSSTENNYTDAYGSS